MFEVYFPDSVNGVVNEENFQTPAQTLTLIV